MFAYDPDMVPPSAAADKVISKTATQLSPSDRKPTGMIKAAPSTPALIKKTSLNFRAN